MGLKVLFLATRDLRRLLMAPPDLLPSTGPHFGSVLLYLQPDLGYQLYPIDIQPSWYSHQLNPSMRDTSKSPTSIRSSKLTLPSSDRIQLAEDLVSWNAVTRKESLVSLASPPRFLLDLNVDLE